MDFTKGLITGIVIGGAAGAATVVLMIWAMMEPLV